MTNERPALIVTGKIGLDARYFVLDVPPDLERLVPAGVGGEWVNSGVPACMVDDHEVVDVWVPWVRPVVVPERIFTLGEIAEPATRPESTRWRRLYEQTPRQP